MPRLDVAEVDQYTTAETMVIPPELVGRGGENPPRRRLALTTAILAAATRH